MAGALLFDLDGNPPSDKFGVNSGILGISSLQANALKFRSMIELVDRFSQFGFPDSWTGGDQPFLNNLTASTAEIKTHVIRQFTSIGDGTDLESMHQRKGLIHFWTFRGQEAKRQAMEEYVTKLVRLTL